MSDYVVAVVGGVAVARCQYTGEELARSADAAVVIQKAIDAAAAEVMLGGGVFDVTAPLRLRSKLTLRGKGRNTVLRLSPGNEEAVVIKASQCDLVTIAELTCQGIPDADRGTGVVLANCGDCEVRSVYARDFAAHGIWMRQECFMVKLAGNTTSGNGKSGTFLDRSDQGRGGDWVPNLIIGCTSIGDVGHAFEVARSYCTNIVGCLAYQPGGHGFYVRDHSNSTCITGCRCYQGSANGVLVKDSHEINLSSNIFCWSRGNGVELENVLWGTVSANNCIDNGAREKPQMRGIYMHSNTRSVEVAANAVFNWPGHLPMLDGIRETADCANNQITANNINFFTQEGVVCEGRDSVATNNIACADAYEHPGSAAGFPMVNGKRVPKVGDPFTSDRVAAFLAGHRSG